MKDRASRSLAHVFTLLSLVLPAEPLQIAFRGLHTDDQNLRGTALEYLEGVLPPADSRRALWPFLEDPRTAPAQDAAARRDPGDLLRSHQSIHAEPGRAEAARAGRQTPIGSCDAR